MVYEKLLLATGGAPLSLPIPGARSEGVCYFRSLDDFLRLRQEASEGKSAVVIGGGFIGSEVAAALQINKVRVSMIFPGEYLCRRVMPKSLGRAIQRRFQERGIEVLSEDMPVSINKHGAKFITQTANASRHCSTAGS
ncbi:MAG: FAD-dependent oxidoreductase [Candidatus Sumerlaeota bacterium]|nr:FAD-dependent oxidoreductase [Candidatus Sumerlaeota bacterium]